MIRRKLQEKFGDKNKEDTQDTPENEDSTDDDQDEESERKLIKILSFIRNEFISRGYEGSVSVARSGLIFGRSYEVEVSEGDELVSDASLDLNETIMAPIRASVRNLFNSLAKKAKSWQRVPFADNTTVSLSRSVTILIFTLEMEVSASVSSILAAAEKNNELPDPPK